MKIRSKPIAQLEEEAEEDLKLRIDQTDIDSINTPALFNKYHKEYRIVQTELINCQSEMKRLYGRKWHYYMGKAHPNVYKKNPLDFKVMKPDVKVYIESDEEILRLHTQIELLEMKKKYIYEKLGQINNRSYHINNAINTLKFKHGIN